MYEASSTILRVSTAKQKEFGVSRKPQHDANEKCARMRGVSIHPWFEDVQTAAKTDGGIHQDAELLKQARRTGSSFHKIDRSMRQS